MLGKFRLFNATTKSTLPYFIIKGPVDGYNIPYIYHKGPIDASYEADRQSYTLSKCICSLWQVYE